MPTSPVTLLRRFSGRLLVVVLLAASLAWGVPGSASAACACPSTALAADTERLARNANDVFTGIVNSSAGKRRTDGSRGADFTHEVTVELVYKGDIREQAVQVQTVRGITECDLGRLVNGQSYAFFVETVEETLVADGCGGTQVASPALAAELETLYGAGEPPRVDQPAETAAIEPVPGVDDPTSFTRAAAPGGALVLVGLLGLVVVRRLARRG